MIPKVRYSHFIQDDIDDIWSYIADRNPDAADRVAHEIAKKFKMLSRNPNAGRLRNDVVIGLRQFPYESYNIFYFHTENGVEIYRILHSSRDIVQIFEDHPEQPN